MKKHPVLVAGILGVLLICGLTLTGCDILTGGKTDDDTYTVRFNRGEGGGTEPDSQSVASGTSITLPGQGSMTPPSGKTFTGWKTGNQTYNAGDSYTVTGDITFTAQWVPSGGDPTYTVHFDPGEGSGTAPDSQSVASGTSIPLPGQGNMIPPSGKIFTGWKTGNQTYNAGDSYTVTGDITFTAQWAPSSGEDIPGVPTGVTATALSSSSMSVSWNQVNGATSYEVYYETGSLTTKTLAETVLGTAYTHTGLQASTTYTYYIKAKNSAGSSDYSSAESAITLSSSNTDPDSAKVFIPLPWGDE
jgi:hypothetical protein